MESREVTDENYFEVLAQKEPVGKKVLTQEEATTEIEDKDLEKLCEIALQTRNFEIELYWKRTTYYWAFIAADMAAYALVFSEIDDCSIASYVLMGVLSCMGILFSFGWFLANRGSKYWQENWEAHMGRLVRKKYGPIFQTLLLPDSNRYWGIKSYPYSVSRINQYISIFVLIMWGVLFLFPCFKIGYNIIHPLIGYNIDIISYFIALWLLCCISICIIIGIYILLDKTRSGNYTNYEKGNVYPRNTSIFYTTFDIRKPSDKQ